jgi:ATP/maltotriose-dependent transcriptional regulator MalT
VALDAARSWFGYHHLFADLLRLELRRTAPGEVADPLAANPSNGVTLVHPAAAEAQR